MNHSFFSWRTALVVLLVFYYISSVSYANDNTPKADLIKTDTNSLKSLFFKKHNFSELYLAFAGPYPSSPTSSFGHVFALLKPTDTRPFLLWDVVEFSADLNEYSSWDFFIKGIFSSMNGYYRILSFSEKLREYTFIENRSIWLFPIRIDSSERLEFLESLYQLESKALPYRFSNLNCASEIYKIINNSKKGVLGDISSFLILPKDIIEKVQSDSCMIIRGFEQKSKADKDNENFNNPDTTTVSNVKELLVALEKKYATRKEHLNEKELQELKQLRQEALFETTSDFSSLSTEHTEFSMHPTIYIHSGMQHDKQTNLGLIGYRFGLHDFFDIYDVYPMFDYLSIFDLEIAFSSKNITLNKLMLFDQSSQTPFTTFIKKPTWRLALGMNRKNEFATRDLAAGAFLHYGFTLPLLSKNFSLSLTAYTEPVYLLSKGFYLIAGAEASIKVSLGDFFRYRANVRESVKNIKNLQHDYLLENLLCFNWSKRISTHIVTTTNSSNTDISLKLLYYVK